MTMISGRRTYRCGYCQDTGHVAIWRPSAMKLYREKGKDFKPLDVAHRFVLPCCCDRGEKITPEEPHYRPSGHPRCFADPEASEDIVEATLATLVHWERYLPVPVAQAMDLGSYDPERGW